LTVRHRLPVALLVGVLWLTRLTAGCFAQTQSPAPNGAAHSPAAQGSNHAASREKILRYVRERFNIPDNVKLTVGPFRDSVFPDFYETALTLDDGKQPRTQKFYVSKDERYLVEGNIYTLGADPKREIIRSISLQDQPSQGPADAPVTIVEFADLQCPMCARLHEMLEKDVVPKYGNKIRVVFKDFPITSIHDWALTGAIASQCAYQLAPEDFVAFRTLVFQNQTTLTETNARDMLLHLGAQVGIDNLKLASCVDSKATLSRVEANLREGEALGIASVPTSFVNGRVVVSAPEPAALYMILDEALRPPK
jgi:protein-disulfide isomerase